MLLIFDHHRERICTPRDEDDDENYKTEKRNSASNDCGQSSSGSRGLDDLEHAYSLAAENGSVQVDCSNYNLLKSASINCSKWVD